MECKLVSAGNIYHKLSDLDINHSRPSKSDDTAL